MFDGDPASPRKKGTPTQFVAHVYCGQTDGWIKMPLDTEVNLSPGDVVLDGVTATPKRGRAHQFSVYVYCGQTAGWMKMPLGTEVDLGPGIVAWAEAYFRTKWRHDLSSRLATIDINRKLGSCAPFRGDLRPHQHNVAWAEVYLRTKWHLDPSSRSATIDIGQNWVGGCSLSWRGAGSPSNPMSSGTRPTSYQVAS